MLLKFAKQTVECHFYHHSLATIDVSLVRPIQEYAKSCLQVAEYQMKIPDGDLDLAKEYLERVATSNAEDVVRANGLLKDVKDLQAKGQNTGTVSRGQADVRTLKKAD